MKVTTSYHGTKCIDNKLSLSLRLSTGGAQMARKKTKTVAPEDDALIDGLALVLSAINSIGEAKVRALVRKIRWSPRRKKRR